MMQPLRELAIYDGSMVPDPYKVVKQRAVPKPELLNGFTVCWMFPSMLSKVVYNAKWQTPFSLAFLNAVTGLIPSRQMPKRPDDCAIGYTWNLIVFLAAVEHLSVLSSGFRRSIQSMTYDMHSLAVEVDQPCR